MTSLTGITIPRRAQWAVGELAPGPGERVLEVGPGTAASAHLIAPHLTRGRLFLVDRSEPAVLRIRRKLEGQPWAKHVEVLHAPLATLQLDDSVDAVLCVNVNAFWTGAAEPETKALMRLLAPGGRILIAYGRPPDRAADIIPRVTACLSEAGFHVDKTSDGVAAFGVHAHRPVAPTTTVGAADSPAGGTGLRHPDRASALR